jgi:uncharacterized protein (TIGR02145 family)
MFLKIVILVNYKIQIQMKRIFSIFLILLLFNCVKSQVPNQFKYQAVVRNSDGSIMLNENVKVDISIREGGSNGEIVFRETHNKTTTNNGIVNLNIGSINNLALINWHETDYYIEININDITMGVSQILSVPYAMYAETANSLRNHAIEQDPIFENSIASKITSTDTSNWNNKLDSIDESDPVYSTSIASDITEYDTAFWNSKLDNEKDPEFLSSVAEAITKEDTTNWNNSLTDETDPAFISWDRSDGIIIKENQIEDLLHFTNADETDPVFLQSEVSQITSSDMDNINNLSGINTGDQDLSEYATKDMASENIINLANPVNDNDAATKKYVDALENKIDALEEMLIETGNFKVKDYDGNYYDVVKIGTQIWMAENLRVTHYADGTPIPNVDDRSQNGSGADDIAWAALPDDNTWSAAAYCWYDNDSITYSQTYGALYTWAAAMGAKEGQDAVGVEDYYSTDGIQGVCPDGWHVPNEGEWGYLIWVTLANDGYGSLTGYVLKDTTGWGTGNNGSNIYGYSAVPSGGRMDSGSFFSKGFQGHWWTCTEDGIWAEGYYMQSTMNYIGSDIGYRKSYGVSVRCVKDY